MEVALGNLSQTKGLGFMLIAGSPDPMRHLDLGLWRAYNSLMGP